MNLELDSPTRDDHALAARAAAHHALADVHRLRIVDALQLSDRTPSELAAQLDLGSNLLAFHLDVLEDAGLIDRSRSEGDGRRRYVRLRPDASPLLAPGREDRGGWLRADDVLFVCTANSARSQLAAALWERATGLPARSAGAAPAATVHPLAREVAGTHGLELGDRRPQGYDAVTTRPDLVVSVCDRANEAGLPFDVPRLHWSIPDPVGGGRRAVEAAYEELTTRITWLAAGRLREPAA
jgi:ArsR family transcriptional regulator, arsenate/arsenite/antimonite-responsive transcriptional repressor / arsenate reductase (thioredoxin)